MMKVMRNSFASSKNSTSTNTRTSTDSSKDNKADLPLDSSQHCRYYDTVESRKRKFHGTNGNSNHETRRSLTPVPSSYVDCCSSKRRSAQRNSTCTQAKANDNNNNNKYVLVTGGAGYIGSHTVLELLNAGYSIVVMDNLVNANLESLSRVEHLSGKTLSFIEGDVTCEQDLVKAFELYPLWAVVHFAAIKAVGESTQIPLDYYHNNVTGSLLLFRMMNRYNVKNLVFSSSATVYGEPDMMPVNETASLKVTNPYGRTKLFVEEMLRDVCASDPDWNVCLLRFFNPVGAHPSGLIGECPQGIPNNLLPYVIRVLQGHLPFVQIFGSDYDTIDGTGVRDYIHVCDLATGHVAALKKLEERHQMQKPSSPSSSSSSSPSSPMSVSSTASSSLPIPTASMPSSMSSLSASSSISSSSSSTLSSALSTTSSPPSSSSSLSPLSSPSSPSSPSSSSGHRKMGQCLAYNLGTGAGYSVLEIIHAMEKATSKTIPYKIVDRRPGDVGVCTADATLANEDLNWKPLYTMDDMCQDMWRWTRRNPNGYDGPLIDE